MNFYDKTNLILRLDQMIRLRFRGNADSLSQRLGVSRSTFFRLLDDMKSLDAPIEYDETGQFYYYKKVGRFRFGFYKQRNRPDIPFSSKLQSWKQDDL